MQNVLIVGAGTGGSIILDLLQNLDFMHVEAVIDQDEMAPGILKAKQLGIAYGSDWRTYLTPNLHIIFDVTGDEIVFSELLQARPAHTVLIPSSVARLLARLLEENHTYMTRIRSEVYKQRMIFDSIEEGMIGIDQEANVDFYNKRAAEMIGISIEEAIGKPITELIPTTKLIEVFQSGQVALNQELVLGNGLEIVTSRFPLFDDNGEKVGAFAVFKDMTEFFELAEEITDLKRVQTMLEAIIHSSEDAISVVDEKGNGILVNPAYTRITGLTEEEVLGKPATADINEGESIHMKVLKTGKAVRGVNMFVGEQNKEVIVNVAPILVNEQVKGSVGVIHDMTEMRQLMDELDEAKAMIRALEAMYTFDDVYGQSTSIQLSIEQAKLAAQSDFSVLLRGEVGAGKERFAHAIHSEGIRKFNPFVRVYCAGIESAVLDAEIFGQVENGRIKEGLLMKAVDGTLLIDELAELPLFIQEKLLHFLQTGEMYPLGSDEPVKLDVRLITATSENLEKAIHDGTFLADLYYVLSRISIQVPPLRTRKEDIPIIVSHLLMQLNEEFGMNVEVITKEAQDLLTQYDWPGNVRELENVLNRAMIYMHQSDVVLNAHDITKSLSAATRKKESANTSERKTLATMMDDYEKSILEKVLIEHQGNKSMTADQLGISLRSLYYKLEKFDLV